MQRTIGTAATSLVLAASSLTVGNATYARLAAQSAPAAAPRAAVQAPMPARAAAPRGAARIRETTLTFPTYPFDDPNPIPVVGRIYPYFRFDGFSATSAPKAWQVVELENEYIRVLILPEIGGKVWGATEKRSGRPFIYYNRAVKFRDIAMRGPWTSGGIEANYGIIGHTPNVSTPVDYVVRRNADGSVSCITGALDLLTNTTWRVETRLAAGEAAFTTTSTWYNGSSLEEPYYHWMTAGIPVQGTLQYVFPGTSQIGHDGERGEWPVNTALSRDVSWYEKNDFKGYKSYHVTGGAADFFGAFWHDQNFGMARVAPRDEKPGGKIWIWGLSRQGMIWEDLLTDRDGQYSELQSGRLFNQSAEGSTFTPFKHRGFAPRVVDRWTERWMPVVGTKGFVVASAAGALNVTRAGDLLVLALSPTERIDDTLTVVAGTQRLAVRRIVRAPLQPWVDTISLPRDRRGALSVTLGDHRLDWHESPSETALQRPLESPKDFDWTSAYGLWLQGKELMRQREYVRAAAFLDGALAKAPHFVPALADRAALLLRSQEYANARDVARRALAVDTYDGAANYYYALANRALFARGEAAFADVRDGFEIAAQSAEYRQSAWVELAKLWLARGDETRALEYAAKALAGDAENTDALSVRAVAARRRHDTAAHRTALAALERADPLSQVVRFERLLAARAPHAGATLFSGVRSELPEQAVFAAASWYQGVGDLASAQELLAGVGDHPEALYWRAALLLPSLTAADTARAGGEAMALIGRANAQSPRLVLPHRTESLEALARAMIRTTSWKPQYYLALGYWGTGRAHLASALMLGLGTTPDFAPFYAARAALPGRALADQLADLERAAAVDSGEWRYGKLRAEKYLEAGDTARAVAVAGGAVARFPASYILGMTYVRALMAAQRFAEADAVLGRLTIIPFEGSAEGHALHREAKLMLAIDAMRDGRWSDARALITAAREWPERLGAGKPYAADVDERLEDWLAADVARRSGAPEAAAQMQAHPVPPATGLEGRVIARWRQLDR
ncbi:MAG: DUF5107 domain-containing protein [Gemmatimonadota bacterium]|nr:DUF5107 domain-containing protein [Gemmatimonadota bacterium]